MTDGDDDDNGFNDASGRRHYGVLNNDYNVSNNDYTQKKKKNSVKLVERKFM